MAALRTYFLSFLGGKRIKDNVQVIFLSLLIGVIFPFTLVAQATFVLGETVETDLCEGILYDTGGPDSTYAAGEMERFTICPSEASACIFITVENYNTEKDFDELLIYEGRGDDLTLLRRISGRGFQTEIITSNECVTIEFVSDFFTQEEGFRLSWNCSSTTCPITETYSCSNPFEIDVLPFALDNEGTCFAGNAIEAGPCSSDEFLAGEEFIFVYSSDNEACISIVVEGVIPSTGIAVFRGCPSDNLAEATCIAQDNTTENNQLSIADIFLREASDYYIVIANEDNCTPFSISITEATNCSAVFPSATACADALPIRDCDTELPTVLSVEPGQGDIDFFQLDVNNGCWEGVLETNYTWFTFEAQTDGEFAFLISNTAENETLDIDFNIWGPFPSASEACNTSFNTQPIRSSWADAFFATSTGLTNINPMTGAIVTDTCQGASGDGYLQPITALTGEVYVILINDFDGIIFNGTIAIDFGESSNGILGTGNNDFSVSSDTTICLGESTALNATGGILYEWSPSETLNCTACPSPVATPTQTTTYTIRANNVCNNQLDSVTINVINKSAIEAMPNAFTPDGDMTNDFFNLVISPPNPELIILSFQIYNRWGTRVYNNETTNQGWDGNYKGERQPPDVYIYTIEYQIGERVETLTGDVVLIR